MELKLISANLSRPKPSVKLIPCVFSFTGKNQKPIKAVLTMKNGTQTILLLKVVSFIFKMPSVTMILNVSFTVTNVKMLFNQNIKMFFNITRSINKLKL